MASRGGLNLPSVQRSVNKLSGKKGVTADTAKRIARKEETEKSTSPTTSATRKRRLSCNEVEDDSPASKRMATDQAVMAALVRLEKKFDAANERLKDCAQKDDLTAIEISIRDKVRDNERRLNRIESEMSRTAQSVKQLVEDCVEARVERRNQDADSTNGAGCSSVRVDQLERQEYIEI